MTGRDYPNFYALHGRWLGGDWLYKIYIAKPALCGAVIGGQFYDEKVAYAQLQAFALISKWWVKKLLKKRAELDRVYDEMDPLSQSFRAADKRNFQWYGGEIERVVLKRGRHWWTSHGTSCGTLHFHFTNGKRKWFVLIGEQDVDALVTQLRSVAIVDEATLPRHKLP